MAQRSIPCVRPPMLQIMIQQQHQQQQQNLTQDYLQQDSPPTTPKKRPRECSSQDSLYVRNPCPCNPPELPLLRPLLPGQLARLRRL
jgi:hypothetical protein